MRAAWALAALAVAMLVSAGPAAAVVPPAGTQPGVVVFVFAYVEDARAFADEVGAALLARGVATAEVMVDLAGGMVAIGVDTARLLAEGSLAVASTVVAVLLDRFLCSVGDNIAYCVALPDTTGDGAPDGASAWAGAGKPGIGTGALAGAEAGAGGAATEAFATAGPLPWCGELAEARAEGAVAPGEEPAAPAAGGAMPPCLVAVEPVPLLDPTLGGAH